MNKLIVGTRGSQLARAQTAWVMAQIQQAHPRLDIELRIITTSGDRQQSRPLPEIGGKGLFTLELEEALRSGEIHLAVHSAKDLPTDLGDGLAIVAYPVREDPRDAWIACNELSFDRLPPSSVVGTSSLRRQAQLLARRPDLRFVALRGNVDTRLGKVHRGDCAGAVLAMAGLKRAGLASHVTQPFDLEFMLPAPGQGALAIEGRVDDDHLRLLVMAIHHSTTALAVDCERAILARLGAGCHTPVAIHAAVVDDRIQIRALVATPDGRKTITAACSLPLREKDEAVSETYEQLIRQGAKTIIA